VGGLSLEEGVQSRSKKKTRWGQLSALITEGREKARPPRCEQLRSLGARSSKRTYKSR